MTDQPAMGPPCDVCGELPAALSILNYADWQQLKLCGNDAPEVMRGIADSMDGRQTAQSDTPAGTDAAPADAAAAPMSDQEGAADPGADGEPGSARDHWASTTNVRRSTHGHRTPKSSAGAPRREDQE